MSSTEYANAVQALKALSSKELAAISVDLHKVRWEKQNGMPFPTFDRLKKNGAKFAKPVEPASFGVKAVLEADRIAVDKGLAEAKEFLAEGPKH